MMSEDMPGTIQATAKICLPQPRKITLHNFSLYDNAPTITADFGTGVYCLAGANGLGKSTFLAALNFAITGIVANPERRFIGVDEYYQDSLSYSGEFFRGRIDAEDHDEAEVVLDMQVGTTRYKLVRGMFDTRALRELTITDGSSVRGSSETFGEATMTPTKRHEVYTDRVTADAGLDSFEQLVFLQHFVVTFDERRHLLFWDERVAQSALFMAFGVNLQTASRAETVRRTAERADSRVRNLQWQATELRGKRKHLEATIAARLENGGTEPDENLVADHRRRQNDQEEALSRVSRLEAELRDQQLQLSEHMAQRQVARTRYEEAFREHLGQTDPSMHPVVAKSIETSHCAVCSTRSPSIATEIQRRLHEGSCPLCGSALSQADNSDENVLQELHDLEDSVARYDVSVDQLSLTIHRLANSLEEERQILQDINEDLTNFERENEAAIITRPNDAEVTNSLVAEYGRQIAELNNRKKVELERRTGARRELARLQAELAQAYSLARDEFVPLFTARAYEFLGLDLDVGFEIQRSGLALVLSVQGTRRRAQDTLSESQRFFVDIALRMALAQQCPLLGTQQSSILTHPRVLLILHTRPGLG